MPNQKTPQGTGQVKKMTVEELQVLITANTKDFNAKIDKANKRLGSLEKQATRTGAGVGKLFTGIKTTAAVAAIQKVVSEVKKLTDAYAENEAAQMGLSSILTAQGKDLNAAKAWLKSYTKDGLIPMMDAYTAYKRLAAAGYSDEQTQSILTNLKDSAAFNRQGSMTMGEAIKSAAEGIKNENSILVDNAGVTKNLSVIWDEYAASIGKSAATLTDAEKRIATTQGIMRETAFQTGDAAKYSNTLAGAQAALKAQTKMLSSALGSMFAPALQQCIPQVTALLERLTALAEKTGQVMAILFGTSSATSRTSSNTAKLANSTQQVSTNLGSAAKKAKDYKNALLGIDEINRLGTPDTGSDSGNGGGSSTTVSSGGNNFKSPFSNADSVIDPKLAERAEELKQKFKKVREELEKWEPAFIGAGTAIGSFLLVFEGAKLFKKIKDLGGIVSAFKSLKFVSKLSTIGASIKGVFTALGTALGASAGAATAVGVAVVAAVAVAIAAVVLLIVYWDEVKAAAKKAYDWIKEKWSSLGEWFKSNVSEPIKETFSKTWDKIKDVFSPATEWFGTLFGSVKQTFDDVFYDISVIAKGCWEIVKAAWDIAGSWFKETVIDPVSNFFGGMWESLKSKAKDAWEGVKTAFSPVVTWFKDKFTQAWTAVKNVFSVGGKIFDGIKEGITAAFKTVVNAIIGGINKVVAIPFNAINKSIDKLRNANILGLSPFADLRDISIPQIPKLATGAVIPPNREFIAMLGDQKNGTNIETPESLLRKVVKEESRGSDGGDWHIQVVLPDGTIKGEAIVTAVQRYNQKSGRTVIPCDI